MRGAPDDTWGQRHREGVAAMREEDFERALVRFEAMPVTGEPDRDGFRLALIGRAHAGLALRDADPVARERAADTLRSSIALTNHPGARRVARTTLAALLSLPRSDGSLPNANERLEGIRELEQLLAEQPAMSGRNAVERQLAGARQLHHSPLNVASALLSIEEDFLNNRLADDPSIIDNQ